MRSAASGNANARNYNQSSLLIRAYLINYKNVVVATVPFHLNR